MSLTEQIITQLKTDFDEVYDAGYQKGLSGTDGYNAGLTEGQSLFGIQNEVTGTNIATCDYVNENQHNVEVKLSSDTVTDFSGCEVKCIGKNFWSLEREYSGLGTLDNQVELLSPLPKGKYTMSFDVSEGYGNYYMFDFYDKDKKRLFQKSQDGKEFGNFLSLDVTDTVCFATVYTTAQMTITNIQIELGSFVTAYEPYFEKTYTANADGTVDVTSISPTMNIICDTEGVNVSAKYYCMQDVEWHRFWDNYQDYGTRTDYRYAFSVGGWGDDILKPKYKVQPTNVGSMFIYNKKTKEVGDWLDISKCADISYLMRNTSIEKMPPLNMENVITTSWAFAETQLESLVLYNVKETIQWTTWDFYGAKKLKHLSISGVIGKSISFQDSSLLTNESVQNIIDCLKDLTGTTTQTLTLHADVKAKLTEEQIASITAKNWTLA